MFFCLNSEDLAYSSATASRVSGFLCSEPLSSLVSSRVPFSIMTHSSPNPFLVRSGNFRRKLEVYRTLQIISSLTKILLPHFQLNRTQDRKQQGRLYSDSPTLWHDSGQPRGATEGGSSTQLNFKKLFSSNYGPQAFALLELETHTLHITTPFQTNKSSLVCTTHP